MSGASLWLAVRSVLPMAPDRGTFRTMPPPLTLWMLRRASTEGWPERLKAPVLKTGSGGSRLVGSNPTPPARSSKFLGFSD